MRVLHRTIMKVKAKWYFWRWRLHCNASHLVYLPASLSAKDIDAVSEAVRIFELSSPAYEFSTHVYDP